MVFFIILSPFGYYIGNLRIFYPVDVTVDFDGDIAVQRQCALPIDPG